MAKRADRAGARLRWPSGTLPETFSRAKLSLGPVGNDYTNFGSGAVQRI